MDKLHYYVCYMSLINQNVTYCYVGYDPDYIHRVQCKNVIYLIICTFQLYKTRHDKIVPCFYFTYYNLLG